MDDRGELAVVDGNLVDVGLGVGGDGVAKGGGVRGSVRDGAGLDTLEDLVLALGTLNFEIVKVGGDLGGGALDTVGGAGDILRGGLVHVQFQKGERVRYLIVDAGGGHDHGGDGGEVCLGSGISLDSAAFSNGLDDILIRVLGHLDVQLVSSG